MLAFLKKYIFRPVKKTLEKQIDKCLNARSNYYIDRINKTKHEKKQTIRVGFLVQMPELWSKQESVYKAMINDDRFDPFLIIVPAFDFVAFRLGDYGNELNYFINECLNEKFIKAFENKKWEDIRKYDFDYLFYQRPYDTYLPKTYRSYNTVKYTKICYIPYATSEMKNTRIYPNNFFRNIYFGFMEDLNSTDLNNEKHKHKNHVSFYNAGYPTFEKCLKMKQNCNYRRVLWTPRWTYEKHSGGSHFFEYNEFLTNFKWNKNSLTIRPHPLMWDEFKRKGLISEEKKHEIKKQWLFHNITEDNQRDLEKTISESDILISDRSSVIPMFFLTGKPVIYCPYDITYSSLFSKILPGLYIAKDENEIERILRKLFNHKDVLYKIRNSIIKESFSHNFNATEQIITLIKDDFDQSVETL